MRELPFISVRFIAVILDTLEELGVSQEEALENSNITSAQLAEDHSIFPLSSIQQVYVNAVSKTGLCAEELGYRFGKNANSNAYGAPGFAAISEENFGKAVEIAQNYLSIICPTFSIERTTTEEDVILTLKENVGLSSTIKRVSLCGFVGTWQSQITTIIGGFEKVDRSRILVELPFEPMEFLINDETLNENKVVYNCAEARMTLPKEYLELSLPLANRYAAVQTKKECEQLKNRDRVHLVTRIRDELMSAEYTFPSLEDFADKFHVSSRKLHRLLNAEGYSFRLLVREVKMLRAKKLLRSENHSITEVADILGYANTSNFAKAFKASYEKSPRAYVQDYRQSLEIAAAEAAMDTSVIETPPVQPDSLNRSLITS